MLLPSRFRTPVMAGGGSTLKLWVSDDAKVSAIWPQVRGVGLLEFQTFRHEGTEGTGTEQYPSNRAKRTISS